MIVPLSCLAILWHTTRRISGRIGIGAASLHGIECSEAVFIWEAQGGSPQVGAEQGDGLGRSDAGMRALRSKPLPARRRQRAVGEMAIFQRQEQNRVDENKEGSRGADSGIGADLGLSKAEQSLFVAEVELDLPAPEIGL